MIVRDRPHGLHMFFVLRGSILPKIAWQLVTCICFALLVTFTSGLVYRWKITLTTVPFSLMGLALAIFLGFRNSAAYDRYWEARKLWGDLVHRSRSLARQAQTLAAPGSASRIVPRTIAFSSILRHQLRHTSPKEDLERLLGVDEATALATSARPTQRLLLRMGEDIALMVRRGQLDAQFGANMDQTLSAMAAVAAGCERIQNTPLPFAYTLLLHRTAWLYCFLLPFGLVDSVGFMTPFVVAIVAYTFFGLDALGDEIEDPFGVADNHLPLDAICREIEISLLDGLGRDALPPPLQPVNSKLT